MSTILTLQPSDSGAGLRLANPTTNYNHASVSGVDIGDDAGDTLRWLLKFDGLDDGTIPPENLILSATLSIMPYQDDSANARTCRVFRQKRIWVPSECTWNVYASGQNWQTAGGFGADDCEQDDIGSREFSDAETLGVFKDFALDTEAIRDIVRGVWDNNGFLLKMDVENNDSYLFYTQAYHTEPTWKPKLVIEHEAPPPFIPRMSVI
jgi:hypothetical protein